MELFNASNQWATRPDDERFWDLEEAKQAMLQLRERTAVMPANMANMRVQVEGTDMQIVGNRGIPATISNFAFGQLCRSIKAPPSYVRTLPPTLAAQNVNHGLKQRYKQDEDVRSLFLKPKDATQDKPILRAYSSEVYNNIWNFEVFEKLQDLEARGWRTPPARPPWGRSSSKTRIATEADVLSLRDGGFLSVRVGDAIAPAGIYASDHDMFVFMVNENEPIDAGNGKKLSRGFFLWNGEVPGVSFGMTMFLYNHVCGNHIVWGAENVTEIRRTHVGKDTRTKAFAEVKAMALQSGNMQAIQNKVKDAQARELGKDKDDVLETINAVVIKKRIGIPAKTLDAAYDFAEQKEDIYGPPNTLWGMVNALTELNKEKSYADDRNNADRAAGKLLEYF